MDPSTIKNMDQALAILKDPEASQQMVHVSPFRECWEMLVPKFTPFPVHILNKYLTFERIQIPRLFLGV